MRSVHSGSVALGGPQTNSRAFSAGCRRPRPRIHAEEIENSEAEIENQSLETSKGDWKDVIKKR
jgi:hypothetical protein